MGLITDGVVFILFLGPLIASGVALLGGESDEDDAPIITGRKRQ